jgi:DHA1 family bicyclomycin/chloramphenicol resistance-like MFS transporter
MSAPPSPSPFPEKPTERAAARFAERRSFVALIAALATIGPFSTDTFLPGLPALEASLGATPLQAQQALSAYMLGFGIMSLWHGAISDAVGRRPVILTALAIYAVAALACTLAPSIEVLIAARLVQGLFGGAGSIVSRAIIRDCFEGARAQRLMATVMLLFAVAPAVAPILGGHLYQWWGWRSVFAFMTAGAGLLFAWTWAGLPETHPPTARVPLDARRLAADYRRVFTRLPFMLMAAAIACNFATFFVYVMASPAFILRHLRMGPTDFGWFFIPVIAGMMLGSTLSGRLAGRMSARRTVSWGYLLMGLGTVANVALQWLIAPDLAPGRWLNVVSIAPLALAAVGQAMISPSIQILMMDLFPNNRGMASSAQGFAQVMLSTLVAGLVAPLASGTALTLAMVASGFGAAGYASWRLYLAIPAR